MIKRHYPKIEKYIKDSRSILILGPRGAGKTFYLNSLLKEFKNVITINLLDSTVFERYLKKPGLIYSEVKNNSNLDNPLFVFIDEVQLIPILLNEVHRTIEEYKERVIFVITGSSARKLKRENANLLAGRAHYMEFFTLSSLEIDYAKNFERIMQFGTLPTSFTETNVEYLKDYLRSYTSTYLREEIQQESEVRKLKSFSLFLELAASVNGSCVNYSKIARKVSLSSVTIKEYFNIIEDTLLVKRIDAWTYSTKKKLQLAPKFYFFDNGVLNSLTGNLDTELKESTSRYGTLFENLVINEFIKLNAIKDKRQKLFHYRTQRGEEIDLIVQKNFQSTPIAIEIKSSTSPDISDLKPLKNFKKLYPQSKLMVLCQTPIKYEEEGISFYPWLEGIDIILDSCPK